MSDLKVKYVVSDGLYKSPIFGQAITVSGNNKTIYIGGQNALDINGKIIGEGDLAVQTKKVIENLKLILNSEKATFDNIIKLNIYLTEGCDPQIGLSVFQEEIGTLKEAPLITVLFVSGLANPSFLIEIDGIAVIKE